VLYSPSFGLAVPTTAEQRIVFGDASGLEQKVIALAAILPTARARRPQPSVIDVAVPKRPVFR
jgi:hypothetical protein